MRWVWFIGLSLLAGRTEAEPHPHVSPDDVSDVWREMLEPHDEVLTAIVARARTMLEKLEEGTPQGDAALEQRVRSVNDAYGILRYARKLSPEDPEVLQLFAAAADELGKTRQAIEALEACVQIQGPDDAGSEVTGRLGMIYLRLGKLDDAIRWLRYAQGPIYVSDNAVAAVHLATALAAHGEMPEAIDRLSNALPPLPRDTTQAATLVSFALAVHYDRDEQRGAAFAILDKMQTALQQELGSSTQHALSTMRFAPPEDQYYYRALLYEALGDYTEARAEWVLYASVTDAPWRRRALDHVRAIDAQRRAQPGRPPAPQPSPPPRPRHPVP